MRCKYNHARVSFISRAFSVLIHFATIVFNRNIRITSIILIFYINHSLSFRAWNQYIGYSPYTYISIFLSTLK